ncbi:MAG: triose-phosphate isomerase [Candidatus Harrisonbacteria bacterium RIFCSPLOWO2_02_FULL_45_10c]|uniref:Triosephosphate isomerase n=1 Tax=Candidatus Harrisonbacteria bacterium RIFCSPLOWO2_02_FULL_45_10c TaxID=1798410 RepID=A0A1G1ZTT2_9BACT|nr:MAG: triose-phosphate isomerase [Candidatus Harrisonbacteria bacterium RIFCSPLOWO2_02_FULL_45_10c]
MKKLIVFNWKMNPETVKEAVDLAKASDSGSVVVAPPFPFLEEVAKHLKKAKLGAQDLFWEAKGAFTGEVSARELKDLCVQYVIIGHSERRRVLGETDEVVAKKLKAAAENGLIPVLCVGETVAEKKEKKTEAVIRRQLEKGLSSIISYKPPVNQLLIAYEPVWAIGTGNPETPESALETIKYIKSLVVSHWPSVRVLYGGSVNSKNLMDYIHYKEIAGALVGGASLKKDEVKKIISLI